MTKKGKAKPRLLQTDTGRWYMTAPNGFHWVDVLLMRYALTAKLEADGDG